MKPAHGECIPLSGKGSLDATYLLEGYAYGGGGDRVERVELSLDGGKTWKYCFRRFTDSPLRYVDDSFVARWVSLMGWPVVTVRSTGHGYFGKRLHLRYRNAHLLTRFRSCEVKVQELVDAYEIIVRAQDSRKNYQPENISWYAI